MPVRLYEPTRAPKLWILWLQGFDCSPGLSQRLWKTLLAHPREQELGAITRAQRRADTVSVAALLQVMTPGRMLQLTACLSPEGQPRDPAILQLEQRLVAAAKSPSVWR